MWDTVKTHSNTYSYHSSPAAAPYFSYILTLSLSFAYSGARLAFLPLALHFTRTCLNENLHIRLEAGRKESLFLSDRSFPQAVSPSLFSTKCLLGLRPSTLREAPRPGSVPCCPGPRQRASEPPRVLGILLTLNSHFFREAQPCFFSSSN